MKKFITLSFVVLALFACNNTAEKEQEAMALSEVLSETEALMNQKVTVTGTVTHVCKHGGQKMFIVDESDENQLKITVGKDIPEFEVALEGSSVQVTGTLLSEVVEAACATEEESAEEHEGEHHPEETTETVTYYIEAASFKEL